MASSHSRPASAAVLEPASPTLLNSLKTQEKERKEEAQTAQLLKRRKISHDGCSVVSKTETTRAAFVSSAFTIRHHHHTPQSLPLPLPQDNIKLIPIALLPRSQLPLSWLDPCPASAKRIHSGRLFVANISALELDLHHQQQQQRSCGPVVLAARLAVEDEEVRGKGEEELYVVERVKKGVYAICALGSWVLERDLMVAAAKGAGEEVVGDVNVYGGGRGEKEGDWLEKATIYDPAAGFFAYSRPRKAIMENVALAFGPKLCGKGGAHSLSLETSGLSSVSGLSIAHDEQVDRRDTPEEAIGVGPCEPTEAKVAQSPQELFDNLRSQYLEALYVSKTSVAYFAKGPLSRPGLAFNLPMKFVNEAHTPVDFYREQEEIRRLTSDLRLRETQLQIVLILETISLEASYSSTTTQVLPATTEAQTSQPQRRTKERKQQDLNTLLELLVDRLCIWHAVSFNDTILTTSAGGKSESTCKTAGNDKLRDFCTEVIIPFYAGRLPDQCKAISRKLGGLIVISPTRPAISRSKSGSSAQPGASVKRSHNQKSQQRTLQRVLTDEKMASKSRAPSLSRSNTTPSLDGLKRENSEPPLLSSISGARGGIQKPKRVDNREIDLDIVAKQHEVKLKRMNSLLEQKKELDAAINALRKPNRELVAKDFADTVEKRASMCNTRKSKHPVRNPLGQGVQVMATPRGSRRKDFDTVTGGSSTRMSRALTLSNEKLVPSAALSDDIQLIPSSSTRPSHPPKRQSFSSKHARHSSIHETPTRSSTRLSSGPSNSGILTDNDFDSTPLPRQTGNLFKVFKVPKLPETSRAFMQQQEMSPSTLRKTRSHPNFAHCGNTNDGTNSNNKINNHLPFIHINNVTSSIQETPPRAGFPSYLQPPETIISPFLSRHNEIQEKRNQGAIIFTTPIKNTVAAAAGFTPGDDHSTHPMANTDIVTADATPEKSIYDQLGWNDDDVDDDDDELALP
ncbi:conserved hypothetical protein [Histoplasma capsulatum H143]|uniref:DNA replication regulator Sld3 C-terminal domain-containing protein n=1 Tax=Ajellomyces capsulatus (strain H143) TaxID=544712 RepID=C6H997_AJECH|nr:conserved hypothetical protein [Histoplasma capsulatum H143]